MPAYDDLLDDDPDAQVFDAEPEPVFDPEFDDSSVVVTEPPIISIGRAKRREELRRAEADKQNDPQH